MNPLSPFTYYRRHKRTALLLLVLIGSLTLGVFVMVGVLSTSASSLFYPYHYLTRMSRILAGQALNPGRVAQIRSHPDVAAVFPENGLFINFPAYGGVHSRPVMGVSEADLPLVMATCDLRLKEGRLIEPRAAEIILSEKIVRALGLQIGDRIGHDINKDFYPTIVTELTLVGILESIPSEAGPEIQAGLVSYEYLQSHEAYQPRLFNLLIIPKPGHRVAVNDFSEMLIAGNGSTASVHLETFEGETEDWHQAEKATEMMYLFTDVIVALAAAVVVGMVNQTAITHRLPELGLLHAVGQEKHRLIRRLVLEMGVIVCAGWGFGLLFSITLSLSLNTTPFAGGGPAIDLTGAVPFLFTLPIPLAVIGWVSVSVSRVLNRLDAIAIVERGQLSMEETSHTKWKAAHSALNPLSSWKFYLRHRRRSLALLLSTGLMVLGVSFPAFITTMMMDATWPLLISYSSHASIISPAPTYQAVDPAVLAQIRAHPDVARVIPVRVLSLTTDAIPYKTPLPIYAVREADLPALLKLYGLHLGEGALFQSRSGQIVLTRALAQNRGVSVGDTVGQPVNQLDSMPTTMTVVGLLDSAAPGLAAREGYRIPLAQRWAGFASYEFVEDHEQYNAAPIQALVIPIEGHALEVETWLEESIASPQVAVETFGIRYRYVQEFLRIAMPLLATIESILAVVAAVALAILNYIFATQRQDEFGILHAVGHSRTRLIVRTLRESAGITLAAWLIGAACCLALVLGAQAIVYAPKGMSLDLANVVPWLFTLPIPIAVLAASVSTIGWMLSRLDPVTIIERR